MTFSTGFYEKTRKNAYFFRVEMEAVARQADRTIPATPHVENSAKNVFRAGLGSHSAVPAQKKERISERWGEPVKDFVKAVKEHAKLRGLDKKESYWVCLARIVCQRMVPWTLAHLRPALRSLCCSAFCSEIAHLVTDLTSPLPQGSPRYYHSERS